MIPQIHDLISTLPPECQSNIVSFLPGTDAANLRLASRTWSNIAAEGLFNVYQDLFSYGYGGEPIRKGVLIIRPWSPYGSIAKGLEDWPWMARHIKEIEIYLPDKDIDRLEAAANDWTRFGEDPNAPWELLRDLYRPDVRAEEVILLEKIFSRLPHIESLSVLSKRCPFLRSDELLVSFWEAGLEDENFSEKPFGHQYQDEALACRQYLSILFACQCLQTPIKRLCFDMVRFVIFEVLDELTDTIPLHKLHDLHIVLRMNTLDEHASFEEGSHALARFLGKMSTLQTLTLVCSDDNDVLRTEQHFNYLASWRCLHTALMKTTLPHLEILRLQDFRAPDELLLRFIVKHALSLRKVDLTGCFVGHASRDGYVSSLEWGPTYKEDNFRSMLESLQGQTMLDEFRVRFCTSEGTIGYPLWEDYDPYSWVKTWSDFDWGAISKEIEAMPGGFKEDHFLLNCFLQGLCAWPMVHDNPDLYWDGEYDTSWTKLPQWASEVEEGPEVEDGWPMLRPFSRV